MRRGLLICLLAGLAVPVAAAGPSADGTLAVRDGTGDVTVAVVSLSFTGAVVAQVDKGRIWVTNLGATDSVQPTVTGDVLRSSDKDGDGTADVYYGTNLKLRAVDGHYRIRIFGSGVDLNAVGQGVAKVAGTKGWYSANGSDKTVLQLQPQTVTIAS